MTNEAIDDLNIGEVYINSSSLADSQIKALDQLLGFKCSRLEKKLKALQLKRKYLSEGKDINVSLNELISRELIEAADFLSASTETEYPNLEEITRIIDTINSRDTSEEKHVHFEESEEEESQTASSESGEAKYEEFQRKKKRSTTLPNPNVKMNLSGEVQLILHNKGTCKPCAFVYNKKKTCRNGPSCGFCHHEDHALCTLKRWKKQQKLASTGSFTTEIISQLTRSSSGLA
eukprot:XP_762905.1 hypothetical protein [Theileria parva strain Muguga]